MPASDSRHSVKVPSERELDGISPEQVAVVLAEVTAEVTTLAAQTASALEMIGEMISRLNGRLDKVEEAVESINDVLWGNEETGGGIARVE